MKKGVFLCVVISILTVAVVKGQSVSFLNFPADARQMAMGNGGFTLPSVFSARYNTAAILSEPNHRMGLGASYLKWQPQMINSSLVNAGGFYQQGKFGISAGVHYHSLGKTDVSDGQGNVTGTFSPTEYSLELGAAYLILPQLSAGITLRHIGSKMSQDNNGSSFAADVSVLYFKEFLRIGLGISNIGGKINYGYGDYNLPTRLKAGMSYQLLSNEKHAVLAVLDAGYQLHPDYSGIVAGIGAEYLFRDLVAFRAGYHVEDKAVGSSYATLGGGIQLNGIAIDLAYLLASGDAPSRQSLLVSLKWVY